MNPYTHTVANYQHSNDKKSYNYSLFCQEEACGYKTEEDPGRSLEVLHNSEAVDDV